MDYGSKVQTDTFMTMSALPVKWEPWSNEKVPGCSRLCNACLVVLQGNQEDGRSFGPRTTNKDSAEQGCVLCLRLLRLGDKHVDFVANGSLDNMSRGDTNNIVLIYKYQKGKHNYQTIRFVLHLIDPACKSQFACSPIQVAPRHSNTFS